MLKIADAEVMITDTGFTQRSGAAQVETQSLYQTIMRSMINQVEFVERTVLKKVENKERGTKQGKNQKEGKTNIIRENFL